MKMLNNKILQKTFYIVLSLLISLSIVTRSLLSLPFIYEQDYKARAWIFSSLSFFIFIFVLFFNYVLIFPNLKKFGERKNKIFLLLITCIFFVILTFGSANYWAVPEVHNLQICFDANDEISSLQIDGLIDPNLNRLYTPYSFSFSRYPIIIKSGECLEGRITMLISKLTQGLFSNRLMVRVQENPPDGRFFVNINEVPAVVYFDHDDETYSVNEIIFNEGFGKGDRITHPWGQHWLLGMKAMAIILCSIYLSLFLFGFIEQIIHYQSNTEINLSK